MRPDTQFPVQFTDLERAPRYRRLGGAANVIVLDNLRESVLAPDIYDSVINPRHRDLLMHSCVIAVTCRIQDPDRKGKHGQDDLMWEPIVARLL